MYKNQPLTNLCTNYFETFERRESASKFGPSENKKPARPCFSCAADFVTREPRCNCDDYIDRYLPNIHHSEYPSSTSPLHDTWSHSLHTSLLEMATQSSIIWPDELLPGTTDNFVSNEVIARNLTAQQIWELLADISKWESYYKNCAQITQPESGPYLKEGNVFKFSTFGFPPLTCTVKESVAPKQGTAGRLAWHNKSEGIEVYHAWIVEELDKNRVRILTQETQNGSIFQKWSVDKPNLMLMGHQDWLDGLVLTARGEKVQKTNLESVNFAVRQL